MTLVLFGCQTAPERAGTQTDLSLTGPVWLLSGYVRESGFIALEPGHGSSARIVLKADGSFEGTTGFSVFSGSWKMDRFGSDNTAKAAFSPGAFNSRADNGAAEQFEQDLIQAFRTTRSIKRGSSAIRFLNASGTPVLDFIALNPDR